ncbi:MAG: hypothetical protein WC443_07675 [Desulfobaccales bacterium]
MKTWLWLILTGLTLMGGCASGYYATGPAYQAPTPSLSGMTFQNPETQSEEDMRIWREESGR